MITIGTLLEGVRKAELYLKARPTFPPYNTEVWKMLTSKHTTINLGISGKVTVRDAGGEAIGSCIHHCSRYYINCLSSSQAV